jgi:hypothetical protein
VEGIQIILRGNDDPKLRCLVIIGVTADHTKEREGISDVPKAPLSLPRRGIAARSRQTRHSSLYSTVTINYF